MKLNNLLPLIFLCATVTAGQAQLAESFKEETPYYSFPIKPGTQNSLAGTMGELRSSHFHTGLDIRTDGKTGLPVHVSADGYISRISVSTSGYGNTLYVTHPNGHTTVYAHLEKFNGPIADYVKNEQYKRKTSALSLYFNKNQFKVSNQEVIAYSGNSGSSGGPHLHYDIRDHNNDVLNPLEYGFKEIIDRTPPIAKKLAVKTLDKYARVNGQFGRAEYNLRRVGNNYVIDQPIEVYGKIGLELYGYDKLDYSRFRCGISKIAMIIDSAQVFQQSTNHLTFAKQREILVHMSYQELQESGQRYHKLYVDDGNELDIYSTKDKGKLNFTEEGEKDVTITMIDSYNNVSYLRFKLKFKSPTHLSKGFNINGNKPLLIDNTLIISSAKTATNELKVFLPEIKTIAPSYIINDQTAVYLWDMNDGLPYAIKQPEEVVLNYQDRIEPAQNYNFYSANIDIDFPIRSLFDTLYMQTDYYNDSIKNREEFIIGNVDVPLRKNIKVTLKPEKQYDKDKYAVYALDSYNNLYYKGGNWSNDKISFYTRNFGKFTIAADSIAPHIATIRANSNELKFKISDNLSGIENFNCTVNGKWVLMHYDYKTRMIWSEKLANENFKGEVKITVTDRSNNKTEKIINL